MQTAEHHTELLSAAANRWLAISNAAPLNAGPRAPFRMQLLKAIADLLRWSRTASA